MINRRIRSPLSLDGPIDNYLSMKNVQMVQSVFPESMWATAFPIANALYTYESFLQGVAKFPKFCNENNLGTTAEMACKKELATVFAHMGQETGKRDPSLGGFWTQALYYTTEISPPHGYNSYDWDNHVKWPNYPGMAYIGRGPLQLSWNYNYGQFSNIYSNRGYDAKLELLEDPTLVTADGFTAFSAAFWFYMTP